MRAARWVVLILAAGLAAHAAERELSGRVLDATTGEPIVRAHITIRFFSAGQPAPEVTLMSDADGNFTLTNMPDGQYQVMCEKAGYLPANQMMGAMPPSPQAGGKQTASMVMKMTAQAAVGGTVVDDRDQPMPFVFLQMVRQTVMNGHRQWQPVQGGQSDETGAFRIYGLPAGRYYVSVIAHLTGARRTLPLAYQPLYYPNASDIAAAQPLDLKAGDEAEIKIKLPPPVRAYNVSGVLVTASSNFGVSLVRQPSTTGFQQAEGDLTADTKAKTFLFKHVPPGSYLVSANIWQEKNPLSADAMISVENGDVSGVRLEPVDTALTGTIRMDDGSLAGRMGGFISAQSDHFTNGGSVQPDGTFHISIPQPGTYRIAPQSNGLQVCVKDVLSGGRDVRDGLTITPGVAPEPLDVVMTAHCGSVDITMPAGDAPPPPNLMAYLLRKSGDQWVLDKQGGNMGQRPNNGGQHFSIRGVTPGDYMVYLWPVDAQIEYSNAEYMRQFESYGQKVTVTEDNATQVTLDRPLLPPAKN